MKSVLVFSTLLASTAAFAPNNNNNNGAAITQLSETKVDLQAMAPKLNPIVPFWDPLGLVDAGFWGFNQEQTIGWLRQAEVKHGRVAMAAFVGYCVQSNFVFPWPLTLDGMAMPGPPLSPPEQWDALPEASKLQIIAFVGFLEWYSELYDNGNGPHYTKGGKPGQFPSFDNVPHSVPFNLYDPFKWASKQTEEQKEKRLLMEVNNGRLAMLGIFGFMSESKITGSVPLLKGIIKPYDGDYMAPLQPLSFFGGDGGAAADTVSAATTAATDVVDAAAAAL